MRHRSFAARDVFFVSGAKGVTLFEIIIVMVIISVCAALAVPHMQKTADQKKADSAINTLRAISECIKQYKIDHDGSLPANATYALLESEGCLDRGVYEKSYRFPARGDKITTDIKAVAVQGTRMVCLKMAGEVDAWKTWNYGNGEGYFLDFDRDGNCDSSSPGLLRMQLEDSGINGISGES